MIPLISVLFDCWCLQILRCLSSDQFTCRYLTNPVSLHEHVWTNQVKMKICVILCCFLSSVTPVDQDNVGDSLQLVRDNVDYLESVIRDQNDEIELLRRNLTETLKYDKMQEMVETKIYIVFAPKLWKEITFLHQNDDISNSINHLR